ncbi:DUF2188 domain-containing protein [Marmoricola sp. RAF53]|uniref:DUF2188 domain-containing protein n=1 Tax=Marmoricola sp. RAF53 TaxID=3233059 RepID=UPI003F9E1D39
MLGNIETAFDGDCWYNRVVGSYQVANCRDTAEQAELKGREMARARHVEHVVRNQDGDVVRQTRYS